MSSEIVVIGVDPGLTTGIAALATEDLAVSLVQATPGAVLVIVQALIDRARNQGAGVALAVERFVSGPRSAKLATAFGAATAKTVIGELQMMSAQQGVPIYMRSAGEVKPWATDLRMAKLIKHRGMPHAHDALRHALYCAVRDYGLTDPLSRGFGAGAGRRVGATAGEGAVAMLSGPASDAPQHPARGT